MESPNHLQSCSKTEDNFDVPSAFDGGVEHDMELKLVGLNNEENENGRLPDVVVEAKISDEDDDSRYIQETYFTITIQVFIPFLIAGLGMVCAGLVLDKIQVRKNYFNRLCWVSNGICSTGPFLKQ